ncbi:DUF397 domain-containing protein [Actinokineospora enzanensis]|uniref:DUF397 domain-containing protein n=1 Tax=Actinokineospora enzanensis TaxID=155975 RepID=UPI0009FFF423|nr:DUF397 domain-containing protein [Actinokineospora enzanensis]
MTAPRFGDWTTASFRKSSRSGTNGGDCVEVAGLPGVVFRKSSYSSTNGGNCVEVGALSGVVAVRDSKNPAAGLVELPASAWAQFLSELR